MEGLAAGELGDLLAAGEAIGDDERVGAGAADGGQERALSDPNRDVVVVLLETEGAGHAAAAGVEDFEVEAEAAQERFLGVHRQDSLLLAMALDEGFA